METLEALKVLLVEDNPLNQRLVTLLLKKKNMAVTVAPTGQEALHALENQRDYFDVVLMDIQMLGMDGYETTRTIRKREAEWGRRIPVIAITAHTAEEDWEKCKQAGMDGYISKPIYSSALYQEIMRVVDPNQKENPWTHEKELPLVDLDEIFYQLNGDKALMEEVISVLSNSVPGSLTEVKKAILNQDAKALARTAHGLKGALGNMGAKSAYQAAQDLEKCAKEGRLDEASALLRKLDQEVQRILAFFNSRE